MLERLGLEVETASDGLGALEVFERDPARYDCILLDLTLPHLDGEVTFRKMREVREDVCVVISSEQGEQDLLAPFGDQGPAGILQKPYRLAPLGEVLVAAMKTHEPA